MFAGGGGGGGRRCGTGLSEVSWFLTLPRSGIEDSRESFCLPPHPLFNASSEERKRQNGRGTSPLSYL